MAVDGRDLEEGNTAKRAEILGLHYLDTRTLVRRPLYRDIVSEQTMSEHQVIPIVVSPERLTIGITTMTPPDVLDKLRQTYHQQRVRYVLISQASLQEYYELYNPPQRLIYQDIHLSAEIDEETLRGMAEVLLNVRSEDMLAYFVRQAYLLRASDIHCENEVDQVLIRMRVDGVLYPILILSKEQYKILISAIASAANLSTAANDSQSGHIFQEHTMQNGNSVSMNLRVETMPAVDGMDIVLRFFSFDETQLSLDNLGVNKNERQIFKDIINFPRGLVLIVGPTGSGKSTTLYSLLTEMRSSQTKIITLEDPVEFQLPGVTQIPIDVSKGASFARGLKTVLRLDADIIMVGEIRDRDTALTALQASVTGHLVMSTYHASSTALALLNLLPLIKDNPLFLNSIRLIQAQRLIRRLDDETKEAYTPNTAEREQIQKVVATLPENLKPQLEPDFKIYKPVPSPQHPFGYGQRFALREFLTLNNELQQSILEQIETFTPQTLESYLCRQHKLVTMLQIGILAVLKGETSLAELYRVGI